MEGYAAPQEFEVAIAAPEAFGASFEEAPSSETLELAGTSRRADPGT